MANPKSFPLVRGRAMRVTQTDGCCRPAFDQEDGMVVSDGFVSVALTANINTPDEIVVTNAAGRTCVRDPGCPEFQGYNAEITFCEVSPCLFSIVTGQDTVVNAAGDVIGFKMNSAVVACDNGFSLEVWMGVPGVACTDEGGAFGYLLLPCLQAGTIGDFTIENGAVTFTVTGAVTKDGNGWGVGPYDVINDGAGGPAGPLDTPLEPDDHLVVLFTNVPPPDPTDGCVAVPPEPTPPVVVNSTGATEVVGATGTWTPAGSTPPTSVANLIAGTPNAVVASPTTAWSTGSYVQTQTAGTAGQAHWDGGAWVAGVAP